MSDGAVIAEGVKDHVYLLRQEPSGGQLVKLHEYESVEKTVQGWLLQRTHVHERQECTQTQLLEHQIRSGKTSKVNTKRRLQVSRILAAFWALNTACRGPERAASCTSAFLL